MATQTTIVPATDEETYIQLRLSSGNGPVYRSVLRAPLRDADPSEIPIIDASMIFSESAEERAAIARQIHDAATNNGFFYLKNHGISTKVTDEACQSCLDFFRQPLDIKNRANAEGSKYFNGYKPPKSQRINPSESVDVRETFSWTYDPRYDPSVEDVSKIPSDVAKFMRCEDFPWDATSNIPHFKESIITYWQSCLALARGLVRSIALSLSLPEDYFDEKFSHPDGSLALNYYPTIDPSRGKVASSGAQDEVSIGSHTDFQLFTILWQDDSGGLQVLNRQGQWINAKPIPGTVVVNIADYLQRITNDKYVSTVHRAQNVSGKERISMPFFFGFNLNESCGVIDSCVDEGQTKKYEEVACVDWVRKRVQDMHDTREESERGV